MPCEELDIVWNNIKAEARALADCEPMLASFYHATLLKHENLGSALSYMLANKLASPIMLGDRHSRSGGRGLRRRSGNDRLRRLRYSGGAHARPGGG